METYSVCCEFSFVEGDLSGLFDDLWVNFDLLLSLLFRLRLWEIQNELLRLLLRKTKSGALLLFLLFLLNIGSFSIIDISNQEHGFQSRELGDDALHDFLMLLRVQIDILKSTVIHCEVNFVEELELVSLELVPHDCPDFVVQVDEGHDFLRHFGVALDVV